MPLQKSQLLRLKRIAALLKENRYPNAKTLVEEFRRMDLEENISISCVEKTIQRDIKLLKDEFRCPLAFDRARNGYYLEHHGWDFIAPVLMDDNEMIAAVIGARIAESIFPAPLKNRIRAAVDYLLRTNNPDFLDTADMSSMNILSGLYARLDPEIFMTVFTGWQLHRCVKISYADFSGKESERIIEPHTLVFYENSWYSKGWCRLKKAPRTFALQRIRQAELLNGTFEPDKTILASVNVDDFLGFQKIEMVKLKTTPIVRERLIASPLHSQQLIDGDVVTIPAINKETLFPFLLAHKEDAILLEPAALRAEFKAELQKILTFY